jgi:hypothetical protein
MYENPCIIARSVVTMKLIRMALERCMDKPVVLVDRGHDIHVY